MQKTAPFLSSLHTIGDKIADAQQMQSRQAVDGTAEQIAPDASARPENAAHNALMKRRYDDFLRNRRDLTGRLAGLTARLSEEQKAVSVRLQTLDRLLSDLNRISGTLPPEDASREGFRDHGELADQCRKLEELRLETIRLIQIADAAAPANSGRPAATDPEKAAILLDSLTFGQIFRKSSAVAMPFVLGSLAGALVLAFAIIGSFKGWF